MNPIAETVAEEVAVPPAAVDNLSGSDLPDANDASGEVQAARRRNRRGGRGRDRHESGEGSVNAAVVPNDDFPATERATSPGVSSEPAVTTSADDSSTPAVDARPEGGEVRRRGRGRERNRRERGDEFGDAVAPAEGFVAVGTLAAETTTMTTQRDFESASLSTPGTMPVAIPERAPPVAPIPAVAAISMVTVETMVPVAIETLITQPVERAVVATPAVVELPAAPVVPVAIPVTALAVEPIAARPAAPVEPFVLPMSSLHTVADSAGLQWVNSDSEKIRAVQAAMAAEPAPVHVPRERKAVQAVDDGPLVLVETRKDLSQFKLPFEKAEDSQPHA